MKKDYNRIKIIIQTEIKIHIQFGDEKLYNFLINDVFPGRPGDVKDFLTSSQGGYTSEEVDRLVNQINLQKIRNQKKRDQNMRPTA